MIDVDVEIATNGHICRQVLASLFHDDITLMHLQSAITSLLSRLMVTQVDKFWSAYIA